MKQTKITSIGEQAVNHQEPLLILFDESATAEIKKVAIIHEALDQATYELKVGSTVTIAQQEYHIEDLGETANRSLKLMGHVTLMFKELDEEKPLSSAIYLTPHHLPKLAVGDTLQFN